MTGTETPAGTIELADAAAQAVRELNHRTRHPDALVGPAQLYRLVGELVLLADALPQLLDQLRCWLDTEHHADRLRADNHTDPGPTVTRATTQLADAADAARDLAHLLGRAQQHLAHLGAPTGDPP